jgi:hypothetical protein
MKWLKDWVSEVDTKEFAVDALSFVGIIAAVMGLLVCMAAAL